MDIVIGSGNSRKVITFASGKPMRDYEKNDPIGYIKSKGAILDRLRSISGS